jgi:hypothetical protein
LNFSFSYQISRLAKVLRLIGFYRNLTKATITTV